MRLSQVERKFIRRSMVRSRKLLARVAVMSEMILYDESAWIMFYNTIHKSGVLGALLDTGDTASASTARSALAAAKVANSLAEKKSRKKWLKTLQSPTAPEVVTPKRTGVCYWCGQKGHYGRECAQKLKGDPPTPGSKAAKQKAAKLKLKKKK